MWETRTNMEKKIVDYKVIMADRYTSFDEIVKKHLADGWSLYGPLVISSNTYTYLYREMVKYEQ
jgi:hypothetical protein